MAHTLETCLVCTLPVLPGDGAAFLRGHATHVACYVDGYGDGRASAEEPVVSRDLLLGIHVLIVEDNDSSREMLQAAFEYCGAFVTVATSADQAKAMLREVRPRAIVSDISMPHDGFELIRDVLAFATESGLTVPAVAITGRRDQRDQLCAAGFAAFIAKPIDPFVLASLVEKLTRRTLRTRPSIT